jgi:putative transposase
MSMKKRTFTKEEKLLILSEAQENTVKVTLEKHGIFPGTFYAWKKKFESMGEEGFRHGMTPEHLKEIRRLEKENLLLKQIIADKELEGRLKDVLLKKKFALERKKK